MKKIMIFATMTAMVSLASCQKDEVVANNEAKVSPVFTASINAGTTKTTVDVSNGKIKWEDTDEITITDNSGTSAVYEIKSNNQTTGKATFELKSGEPELGDGPYTATYGSAPSTYQTYSATAGKLYMTASETSNNSFTFTVQCGLMKLNLTKLGETITNIAVTGTPTGGTETTYTLYCSAGEDISSGKNFYIALPAGSYNKIEVYKHDATNGFMVCSLIPSTSIAISANHIKPVNIAISKDFTACEYLPGGFSVSDDNGTTVKQVRFSQGNLYYDGSNFNFEANQYDFRTYAGKNSCIDGTSSDKGTPTGHWGLFGWSTEGKNYGMNTSQYDIDYSGNFKDWGTAIDDKGTWRTLTTAEWQYLFNSRTEAAIKVGYATVCGVNGLIILPDSFTDPMKNNGSGAFVPKSSKGWDKNVYTSGDNWNAMETAGAVFLPAAGNRYDSSVNNVGGNGFYWSRSLNTGNPNRAYYVNFASDNVSPDNSISRVRGYSVRLITESK